MGLFGRVPGSAPYKLFEQVEGAVLESQASPGSTMTAVITARVPRGRRFKWRATAKAGEDGRARIRVPYATGSDAPVATGDTYRMTLGDSTRDVEVSDREVRSGAIVPVTGE